MNAPDNIITPRLEKLAERALSAVRAYEAGIAKQHEGRAAAVAAVIEYGAALIEGRISCGQDDTRFGRWIVERGLDQTKPFDEQQERTAAMKIAQISAQGTRTLGECPRARPTNIMTWWRDQQRKKNGVIAKRESKIGRKVKAAVADAKAYMEERGALPSERDMNALGHSDGTTSTAKAILEAEEAVRAEETAKREQLVKEAVEVKTVKFTKAQDHHVEVKIRALTKKLEKEFAARKVELEKLFWAEVGKACDANEAKRFPLLQQRENKAFEMEQHWRQMINKHKPIFTEEEFNIIRACLHPDNSASEERRRTAFGAFNAQKLQLTGRK